MKQLVTELKSLKDRLHNELLNIKTLEGVYGYPLTSNHITEDLQKTCYDLHVAIDELTDLINK